MKAREFAVFYAACTTQEADLIRAAANLRNAKRLPVYPGDTSKAKIVAIHRARCAALCVKLGLPENTADGTRQQLMEAIANLHPERNTPR